MVFTLTLVTITLVQYWVDALAGVRFMPRDRAAIGSIDGATAPNPRALQLAGGRR